MMSAIKNSQPEQPGFGLADMSPAYFGLVMATGIISLAAFMMQYGTLALGLFYLNIGQYGLLCVLYFLRAWRYPSRFFGDMLTHLTGPGYFTAVATTGILASQFMVLRDNLVAGRALWVFAIVLWLGLTYTIFTAFTVKRDKPTLDKGINGGWLLAVVATQSLAVITRSMWRSIVLVGAVMAAGTLMVIDAALPGGLIEGTGSVAYGQTMAFTTLTLFQLFNVFNARSGTRSAFAGLFENSWLWAAVGLSLLLHAAVIYAPVLQQAFSTVALDRRDWLFCAAVASSVLWVREMHKLLARLR